MRGTAQVVFGNQNWSTIVQGVTPEDLDGATKVVVLRRTVAENLWVPSISRAETAPGPGTSPAPTTTPASTSTVRPAGQILSSPVNAQASPSSQFIPVPLDPDAFAPPCAFEGALDACAVPW